MSKDKQVYEDFEHIVNGEDPIDKRDLEPMFTIQKSETNEAVKNDQQKPEFHLIPFDALIEVSKAYQLGAVKYAPNNWKKGMIWSRMLNACIRHMVAFWWDKESHYTEEVEGQSFTVHHLGSAVFCLLSLIWYEKHFSEGDDR